MHVRDVLADRNTEVVTVGLKTPIPNVARIMTENQIGAVVVVDANQAAAGILSERDILATVGKDHTSLNHISAGELMTESIVTCGPLDTILQVILKFDALGIRHIVVMDQGDMVGVVSFRDVLQIFSRMIVEKRSLGKQQFATELASVFLAA
jgi:signal-transduction protein with cAMP-binding, CBS, and nucleotidyltransferase domain